jgi:hypothetical protein
MADLNGIKISREIFYTISDLMSRAEFNADKVEIQRTNLSNGAVAVNLDWDACDEWPYGRERNFLIGAEKVVEMSADEGFTEVEL